MYADTTTAFASQRLKPRLMTVEIDQATLMRNSNGTVTSIGTPSIVPAGAQNIVGSPTASVMSTPQVNDNIINKKADPAQGLYQTCLTLRERLRDVRNFEQFLEPPEDADPEVPEDPVTQLWRCFRMGSSLCVLFNALQPMELIKDDRLSPHLKTINDCKAATFHFLKGIKNELKIDGEDAFMISNLYSDDTNGFVKVTKTVTRILDVLAARNLLLNRVSSEESADTSEKKPLDSRARVVMELVDTERKYVQDLENLQDYMQCLEREEVVSKDLIHNLFLNLNQLVDFQRRFLIRVETQNSLLAHQQSWGNLFVQYEKSFAVYEPYASNFNAAQILAQDAREQLARFPHPVFENLAAFLIKPVQRVTKYPLLLRDLIKYTSPIEAEEKQLPQGLEAIERITSQINEAIRKSENVDVVKDLEGRVEDWKGHRLENFGELLLHGSFQVIKGDQKGEVEREYYIYLFERILLCCKEMGANKKQTKTMSMGKTAKITAAANKKKPNSLQLKGRIFMQNVTDVISLARNGSYTLQIFWKGDPGVENFMIKHTNEETLNHWRKTLQRQRETFTRSDVPGGMSSRMTNATEFAWMATAGPSEQESRDASDEDDDSTAVPQESVNGHFSSISAISASSRSVSTTSLRSRSATNENMPPPPAAGYPPARQTQPARFPHTGRTPPLTLNTNPAVQNLATSPDRSNGSYFSPVETPMLGSRASSQTAYPFPRYPSSNYYSEAGEYTPPNMSRTSSRDGTPGATAAQYTTFQNGAAAYPQSRGLQRPSLPGMTTPSLQPSSASTMSQQSRMRSASSPNIHHIPSASQSRISPGGTIPPVPSLPGNYIPYSGGPAVINRSPSDSPTSPKLPIQGSRVTSPSTPSNEQPNGSGTSVSSPPNSNVLQVKVKIQYMNDKLAIIVPYNIAYAQLIDRIERKVRICGNGPELSPNSSVRIKYQDEDGDFISMSSDDDVQMAFDAACDGIPKDATGTCGAVTLYVQVG